jgi:hypothetical protein
MAVILLALMSHANAQQDMFAHPTAVKGQKMTVKMINETQTALVPDNAPNQRYSANDLPADLKKDGLHLVIDGEIGEIPANVRMSSTPFRIKCIKVASGDQKKYKLKKKYCFKK